MARPATGTSSSSWISDMFRVKAGQSLTHATSSTSTCVADSGGTPSSVSVTVQVVIPHLSAASVYSRPQVVFNIGTPTKMPPSPVSNESV
eukprot:3055604-Rhodomonas_salina.1